MFVLSGATRLTLRQVKRKRQRKCLRGSPLDVRRVAALKALCEMRLDREDLKGAIDEALVPVKKRKVC